MTGQLTHPTVAEVYDDLLRWTVTSRSDPHVSYVCELADYHGQGRCTCTDYQVRFEPLLAQQYTPERALAEGLVKIRPYQVTADNALRCWHIIDARSKLSSAIIKAFTIARQAQGTQAQRANQAGR
jgi:hypothetical protein